MQIILGRFGLESEKVRRDWVGRPSSAGLNFKGQGKHDQYHLELPRPAGWDTEQLFHWAAERVAHFEIFPPSLMTALVDSPGAKVATGATILIGVFMGPLRLRMADRVLDVSEGEDEKEKWSGFTYGTLEGHVEKGIETFRVVLDKASGKVTFFMEAWSKPGHWLVCLSYPWARMMQKKAGREAVRFMKDRLEAMDKETRP